MLELIDIHKMYEGKPLLRGISFSLSAGETVCLLGPSGGGKSTLLRIIAGLETPDKGQVLWDGKALGNTPPHKRNFGFMFQDYALFPHRSVAQNIAFGLRMKGLPADEIDKKVKSLLDTINLESFGERRVTDLSGGEQQRVALARTLAPNPHLLMLDEPLGALDRTLAEQLAAELRRILKSTGTPTLYVTHDQQEAFTVAERLLLIQEGKIVQDGSPWEVYHRPASVWVARFLGLDNLLEGTVVSTDPYLVKTMIGTFQVTPEEVCAPQGQRTSPGEKIHIVIRSEDIRLEPGSDHKNHIHGRVEDSIFQGNICRVDISVDPGVHLRFHLPPEMPLDKEMDLYFSPASISCVPS